LNVYCVIDLKIKYFSLNWTIMGN